MRLSLGADRAHGNKKMVPSDPTHSQARRRHARPVALATGMTGDGFLGSPLPLLAATDQCLRRPPDTLARAAIEGALANVRINIESMKDEPMIAELRERLARFQ